MYNIFQHVGNTKATEQMYKYWSIKFVEEQDGKRVFHRRAIYEVICVYPGSHMHGKKLSLDVVFSYNYIHIKRNKGGEISGKTWNGTNF